MVPLLRRAVLLILGLLAVLVPSCLWSLELQAPSRRLLTDAELSERVLLGKVEAAIAQLPAVPSGLSCSKWEPAPGLTFGLLLLPIVAVAHVLLVSCISCCMRWMTPEDVQPNQTALKAAGHCVDALAAAAGGWASWVLASRIPMQVPKTWDCTVRFLARPEHILPYHAGSRLTGAEQGLRQQYYVSLMLWLILVAYVLGHMLTLLAVATRACQTYLHGQGAYTPLWENGAADRCFTLVWQILLHIFSAFLAFSAAATGRLDGQKGLCWEVYLVWVAVLLLCSIVQAVALLFFHRDHKVPNLGFATVEAVLPVVGEPLDLFKDYIFIGLAAASQSCSGALLAGLAFLVLMVSGAFVHHQHPMDLLKQLSPVRGAWLPKHTFLDGQTSPAKLAVAFCEDLPQAVIQSIYVALHGGSATQFAFIGTSVAKIVACVTLRHLVLEAEQRYGAAWEAAARMQRSAHFLSCELLGPQHHWTLWWKKELALSLWKLQICDEATVLFEELVEATKEVFGEEHPETLKSMNNLALSWSDFGHYQAALRLQEEVLQAEKKVLGPRHPQTLISMSNLALSLLKAGRYEEALALEEEALRVRKKVLGPRHPDTLDSMHNLALSLREVGRYEEAMRLLKEVVQTESELYGPKHPDTLVGMHNQALTLNDFGRDNDAARLMKEVLEARVEVLGVDHPHTRLTESALMAVLDPPDADRMDRFIQFLKYAVGIDQSQNFRDALALQAYPSSRFRS